MSHSLSVVCWKRGIKFLRPGVRAATPLSRMTIHDSGPLRCMICLQIRNSDMRRLPVFLLAASLAGCLDAAEPFRDPLLPLEDRVNNLVSLLTPDERIAFWAR